MHATGREVTVTRIEGEVDVAVVRCSDCDGVCGVEELKLALWTACGLVAAEDGRVWVCASCGTQRYTRSTADVLDALAIRGFPSHMASRTIDVPVFSLRAPPHHDDQPQDAAGRDARSQDDQDDKPVMVRS